MWSFLSSDQFSLNQWGPHATQLAQLLQKHAFEPVTLDHVPCLHEVFEQWQGTGQQGDPVEFLAHMMRGLQFTGINLRWEKRVQMGMVTETVDEGDTHMPFILQFEPGVIQDHCITLLQMIRDWSNQDGMMQALTQDSALICVQIDRHVRSGDGTIWHHQEVRYPGQLSLGY